MNDQDSHMDASEKLRRTFNRRYAIAIALLAAAVCASFALTFRISMLDTNRTIAFNLVSHQQTDSQRIAFLLSSLEYENDPTTIDTLTEELFMAVARMRSTHRVLIGQSAESERIARFIKPLQDIYGSGDISFDQRVNLFLEKASMIARYEKGTEEWEKSRRMRIEVIKQARDSILQPHTLMALILEAQAEKMNSIEKNLNIITWIATLALMGMITVLIFRPMIRTIFKSLREMEQAQITATAAEEEATKANESKSHFFQAASHELKTPLNAIVGMTDAIRDKSGEQLEVELEQITAASDHLLNLLNNILDTHRISEGRLSLDKREFELLEVVERPIKRIKALAEAKGLDFISRIEIEDGLMVEGDSQRLEQIVTNLVDNAVKFTPDGEVDVDARLIENVDGIEANFSLKVRDTGIGIPTEKLQALFDQNSSEGSMLERSGGLGVGLSLVRAIASSMGGSIDVSSSEGEGSTFHVSIPLHKAEETLRAEAERVVDHKETQKSSVEEVDDSEADHSEAAEPVSKPVRTAETESKLRVLIVDDNMANRMVADALVKPLGALTTMAADGRQAVDAAQEENFDIIFMDISMPVMDGVKATQLIRQGNGPNSSTPVIALTAHVGPGEWAGLGEVGFNDILNKPVRKEVIQRCIEKWVQRPVSVSGEAA